MFSKKKLKLIILIFFICLGTALLLIKVISRIIPSCDQPISQLIDPNSSYGKWLAAQPNIPSCSISLFGIDVKLY